jgi:hypothetical protein
MLEQKQIFKFTYHISIAFLILALLFILVTGLLPDGINKVLAIRSWKLFSVLSIISFGLLLLLSKFQIRYFFSTIFPVTQGGATVERSFAYLIFLPLTPIVQYLILNYSELGLLGSLVFISIFVVMALIFILVMPYLLSTLFDRDMAAAVFSSLLFCFFYMASLAYDFNWHLIGSLKLQLLVFITVAVTVYLLLKVNKVMLYSMVIVYFLFNTISLINNTVFYETEIHYDDSEAFILAKNSTASTKPDIYLLTYDSYVINETMLGYGIDNIEQEKYLENLGFKLYPSTYSLAADSVASMSRVLDWDGISYPNGTEAAQPDGLTNGKPRNGTSGNGVVNKILKSLGYETYGIFKSDYLFTGVGSFWDSTYPHIVSAESTRLNLAKSLTLSVLEGEFRFDAQFEAFDENEFLKMKRRTLSDKSIIPKFVYTHTGPGHTESVCQKDDVQQFEKRLYKSNIEMKLDIDSIIKNNPESIIIINGDHGPYITKNCFILRESEYSKNDINRLDIQDRLGTFLAIKWPDKMDRSTDGIIVLQDIFPMIFSKLFNEPQFMSSKYRVGTSTIVTHTAGVGVKNGTIEGGKHSGEKLFLSR